MRARLLAAVNGPSAAAIPKGPKPIARWDFKTDLRDTVGSMHGEGFQGAQIDNGALAVRQGGHVITAPLRQSIREKTLEAWVQLDSLTQQGGGVMTLQTRSGGVFDAIVFGEREAGHWIAGSDFFHRSQALNGPVERDAVSRPVHIAATYASDGTITVYRDGQLYGAPYRSSGPIEFKAGEAVVGFGVRHLPVGGNKSLTGRILQAQLYDRALTAEEVARSAAAAGMPITEATIDAALSDAGRHQVATARAALAGLGAQIAGLGPTGGPLDEKGLWADVARGIFTFKEFIYLR